MPLSTFALPFALLALTFAPQTPPIPFDFVVQSGETVTYDTANGPLVAHNILIEAGGSLRAVGTQPLHMRASRLVRIDGTINVSGSHWFGIVSIFSAFIFTTPHPGGHGYAGSGDGGTSNPEFTTWCVAGGDALDPFGQPGPGGRGGESGFNRSPSLYPSGAAGGGGGALGPDQLVNPNPDDASNVGRIARSGKSGAPTAFGALTSQHPPRGGAVGRTPFIDNDPSNDFFGRKLDPITQTIIVGELVQPLAGRGGGGGGNSIRAATFPPQQLFPPSNGGLGAGGGGGGGLVIIEAIEIEIGPNGRLLCNGGDGDAGVNTHGGSSTGGGSGGGSGGMVIVQARLVDLSHASAECITALGGRGGAGANDVPDASGAGGNGGPGIIQIHVPHGSANIQLPLGMTLDQLTAPTAHVLLPEPGL
jgi:hypothetical protein